MTTSRRLTPMAAWTPWFAWSEILFKSAEMMMASGQVIGHRVERMGRAGATPSARDVKEFTLMGQEKLEAAAESAQAMSLFWWQAQQQAGAKAFEQMLGMGTAWWSMAGGGAGARSPLTWSKAWGDPWKQAAQWSQSSTGLLNKGLQPIHSRATANARRLGRR
ncbi:MAG: hypothetical protein EOP40_00530 [Rubrivivax sp.]|nr:MAG: hypothetical protein EOP40_00530 [Rubrivivax sp.]